MVKLETVQNTGTKNIYFKPNGHRTFLVGLLIEIAVIPFVVD